MSAFDLRRLLGSLECHWSFTFIIPELYDSKLLVFLVETWWHIIFFLKSLVGCVVITCEICLFYLIFLGEINLVMI